MKIFHYPSLAIILIGLLFFYSCREDELLSEEIISITPTGPVEEFFLINVNGIIKDQNEQAISGATIVVDEEMYTSNQDGLFSIRNIKAPNTGLYVKVLNDGYFTGGTHYIPNGTDPAGVEITLLEKEIQSFDSSIGYEIEITGGALLSIPPSGIQKNGQEYIGSVNIAVAWLDPEDSSTFNTMPGALIAQNENGEAQFLQTFGMMGVEMTDPTGEPLQLREGVKARLNFPLSSALNSSAPETIPLWHFDETNGKWVEEGVAQKSNGQYIAEVAHFSWWNCDIPFNFTKLCLDITDSEGIEINNLTPCLSFNVSGNFCNPPNQYCGFVPINQELTLELRDNCSDVIHTERIGPFNGDINDVTEVQIIISTNERDILSFNGNITNCSGGELIENGLVIAELNGLKHYDLSPKNGRYQINIASCNSSPSNVTLTAIDLDQLETGTKTVDLIQGIKSYEENISTCGSAVSELFIQMNSGSERLTNNVVAYQSRTETLIIATFDESNSPYSFIGFKGFGVGEFSGNVFPSSYIGSTNSVQIDRAKITISRYDDVGGYIIGNYADGDFRGEFIVQRER